MPQPQRRIELLGGLPYHHPCQACGKTPTSVVVRTTERGPSSRPPGPRIENFYFCTGHFGAAEALYQRLHGAGSRS